MLRLDQATPEQLRTQEQALSEKYQAFQQANLNLDLTRGKPSSSQLDLSNDLDGILNGEYIDSSGSDLRNYGGLDGIPEAKQLFSEMIGVKAENVLIGGNGSLPLMHFSAQTALLYGLSGPDSAWNKDHQTVKFLAPVPGYDRHFSICDHLGIELIPIPMNDDGPDMDCAERLLTSDKSIKGIWCVPRFSNPTGVVYSNTVVDRIAKLGNIAGPNFLVFWDNAYAVHTIESNAPELANLMNLCIEYGTEDSVVQFGSTSKVTYAGAGVAFLATSASNLRGLKKNLANMTIGPDKVNQLRHVRFLKDAKSIGEHMEKHAELLKPRFDTVLRHLSTELDDSGMGAWTKPQGGYFVSFDSLPGLAGEIVAMANAVGVKLTPAGATFPGGKDPEDRNIRIAPSFPSIDDINSAMDVFVTCVQLASIRQKLAS